MTAPLEDDPSEVSGIPAESRPGEPRPARELLPWSTTSCGGWRHSGCRGRHLDRRSRRRRSSTRRTCGWSAASPIGPGMAVVISSPRRPRPCGESWSRTPAAAIGLKRGGNRARVDLDKAEPTAPETDDDLLALDEALERLADERPDQGPTRPATRLCRLDGRPGGRDPRPVHFNGRPLLGLRPGLAPRRDCGPRCARR